MRDNAHFQEYVQRCYEADGKSLTEAQFDSYFSGVERGFELGIYFMADLLASAAKAQTIVAWDPKKQKNYRYFFICFKEKALVRKLYLNIDFPWYPYSCYMP